MAGSKLNVKLIGTDTGFSSAWLGFTHLALEDMGVIRTIPGIVIIDQLMQQKLMLLQKQYLNTMVLFICDLEVEKKNR